MAPRTEEKLKNMLLHFELDYELTLLQDYPPIVIISVNIDTPLTSMGDGETIEEAVNNALEYLFEVIHNFLT